MSAANKSTATDIALGAIVGALVGDASGATLEFVGRKPTPDEVDRAMQMVGGGYWNTAPGQVTDDGELTLALLQALIGSHHYSPNRAAGFYRKWRLSSPFDIGQATAAALAWGDIDDEHLSETVIDSASRNNQNSKANGSLMRATPLGVWSARVSITEAIEAARIDAMLTHPNPSCQWACAAYVVAIRHLMLSPGDIFGAVDASVSALTSRDAEEVMNWLQDAMAGNLPSFYPMAGFVRIGFTHAFFHLMNATPYPAAIRATLSGGGDTDTNACIVGGLVGALHGINAIPSNMRESISRCDTSLGRHRPQWLCTQNIEPLVHALIRPPT